MEIQRGASAAHREIPAASAGMTELGRSLEVSELAWSSEVARRVAGILGVVEVGE